MSSCGCRHSLLGSNCFENGTTERPGHRTHSRGSSDKTGPRMERHRQPQPYIYKNCWAQWKSLTVSNGILGRHRESASRRSQIAQIVLPQRRGNYMITQLHWGLSVGHLGVKKTLDKVRKTCNWFQPRNDVEKCVSVMLRGWLPWRLYLNIQGERTTLHSSRYVWFMLRKKVFIRGMCILINYLLIRIS
jgi:hypothetical protein